MTFKTLRPQQVADLERAPAKPRAFGKRRRSHSLACYVPAGEGQASRRVTGVHLDPDGDEMQGALYLFANSLLEAVQQGGGSTRSIVGPSRASDRLLGRYCQLLLKSALGKPTETLDPPVSPAIVPYLLGGITWTAVEDLCYRALEVMDIFHEPRKGYSVSKALSVVGFGPHLRYEHRDHLIRYDSDNKIEHKPIEKRHAHLSHRQDFLLNLPQDKGFAIQLLRNGAYDDTLRRQLASMKDAIIAEVELLLDPEGGEMNKEWAAPKRKRVTVMDSTFERAVRRVFEQPWDQLDLTCSPDPGEWLQDAEVLVARKIIQKLAYNDKMTAEVLVGMSLLTGVSIVNWVNFALEDRDRRGETFLTLHELERAIEMVEFYNGYDVEDEMNAARIRMTFEPEWLAAKRKWARRLQSPVNPLWSTNGLYYQVAKTYQDVPICKPKAFRPQPDKTDTAD